MDPFIELSTRLALLTQQLQRRQLTMVGINKNYKGDNEIWLASKGGKSSLEHICAYGESSICG